MSVFCMVAPPQGEFASWAFMYSTPATSLSKDTKLSNLKRMGIAKKFIRIEVVSRRSTSGVIKPQVISFEPVSQKKHNN